MPILYRIGDVAPPGGELPSPFVTLDLEWSGADGSTWRLTDSAAQVTLLPGMRGLEAPEVDRWTSEAPGMAGARYRGHRARPREVFIPVYLRASSSADWLAIRRAWDHSLSLDDEGTLAVTVLGERRTLPCRHVRTEAGWVRDPLLAARATLGEYLEAAGSYWQGDPITRTWIAADPLPFFMASDGVFYISPSNTIGNATIDNPGDVPAWPVWVITGPCTGVTVGVDSGEVDVPIALSAGQTITIDTRPDRQTVTDWSGADRVDDLGVVSFRQVPAGQSVGLSIDATGTGSGFAVSATLTPLYRRAW